MRRAAVVAFVLACAAAALAGCTSDEPEERPTPRAGTTSPTPTAPSPQPPPDLRLLDVAATPNETELGRPVAVVARISNVGAGAGTAVVSFEIVGGRPTEASARVEPGATAEVTATLAPASGGNLSVRARLGEQETTTALLVRAPRIADLTLDAQPVEPCGAVRITMGFRNVGDGTALHARAELHVMDAAGAPLASWAMPIGDVPPGEREETVANVAEVRAACEGEEPVARSFRFVVRVEGLREAERTGVFVA